MRNGSPVIAFSAAALIIIAAAAASVPAEGWQTARTLGRIGPGLVHRAATHGWVATRAVGTAVLHAPVMLRTQPPMRDESPPPTKVCRGEQQTRVCAQGDCRRLWLQRRLHLLFGIAG
jgi:hypothetical protein